MAKRCDICNGRNRVRLPLIRSVHDARLDDTALVESTQVPWREYPCPECSDTVLEERLVVLQEEAPYATHINEPGYIQATRGHAAHLLVQKLMESGYITFETGPEDTKTMRRQVRATLGVVAPKAVASLEERIAQRQMEVAKEVAMEAVAGISVWGSHFHGDEGHIQKARAIDAVNEALARVAEKRK